MVTENNTNKKIDANGHVAVFYDTPSDRWKILAEYFRIGLERNELCVFVTQTSLSDAIENFSNRGTDVGVAVEQGDMRIFNMLDTYLPHGRFVSDYMLKNVSNFIKDAKSQGYNGLRTAGEMSWLFGRPGLHTEAAVYENDVNQLTDTNQEFTGLCLYAALKDSEPIIKNAIRTHPAFIYDGELHDNPHYDYVSAEKFLTFDPENSTDNAIEKLLSKAAA